jgi:ankyrin repeat protein
MKILGRSYEDEVQQEMEQLFSDKDCLEEMCFTTLHRIVLDLNSSSLEQELSKNPESVNRVDSSGRTALSWAAQRGMVDVVKTLLQFSADPNVCTPHGHSPLQYASEARNPDCLHPLLEHGADVTQHDVEGQTALHYAAAHHGDLAYYRPLIEANSDPNHPTRYGFTPLATVIQEGWVEPVRYLIENGADIQLKGQDEKAPVFYAVEYNNHYALSLLHDKGADFTVSSNKYPTIAHIAAQYADVESLRILASFKLTLNDIDCIDSEGLTIPQIVDKRLQFGSDDGTGFVDAFRAFLESIDAGEATAPRSASASHEGEGEEIFYDALE